MNPVSVNDSDEPLVEESTMQSYYICDAFRALCSPHRPIAQAKYAAIAQTFSPSIYHAHLQLRRPISILEQTGVSWLPRSCTMLVAGSGIQVGVVYGLAAPFSPRSLA